MREKRTDIDFSEHALIIKETDGIVMHHLKKPGTIMNNVKFVNVEGLLLITGDFGNWTTCREFHPTPDGYVSDYYWCEKLTIHSEQTVTEYDPEDTRKVIEAGINGGLEEYGHEGSALTEAIEYYKSLLNYTDESDEIYRGYAFLNHPSFMDAEDVPYETRILPRLQIIFDAFDHICGLLKKGNLYDGMVFPKEPKFDSSIDTKPISDGKNYKG